MCCFYQNRSDCSSAMASTRKPARLLVLNAETGQTITCLPSVGDADDFYYVAETARICVSGGEGFVYVLQQQDPDH